MKKQNSYCEAKVEIISKDNAILLVEKKGAQNIEGIDFKYNDNIASVSAKNTANAKMGDTAKLCVSKRNLDLATKIMYFAPLVFLLAGFLFALKFDSVVYQLVFAICLFLVGTLICLVTIGVLWELSKPKFEVVEIIKHAEIAKTESEPVVAEGEVEQAENDSQNQNATAEIPAGENEEAKND